jgi:dTDP-4-amino-4,6-dideoxygalactose transaminase
MRERYSFRDGAFPVAEETARRTLALPFATRLEPSDQERVADVLRVAVAA